MAKINTRNIALIVIITVLDIGVGLYDRLVNGIGVINAASGFTVPAGDISYIQTLNSTSVTVLTNTGTATNFLMLGAFILAAVFIISIIAGAMGSYGGRQ
jgi:hypothetical protein